jgi:outer membrane protein assembly factor BamA
MQPLVGVAVTVRQFRFAGNTLLSSDQLAPVLANYLNRPLDYTQLQAAAAAVADVYRAAGSVARTNSLPKTRRLVRRCRRSSRCKTCRRR